MAALMKHEPPVSSEIERRIAKCRASFNRLGDQNLPLEILDQLASLHETIASEDRGRPEEIRTEFALRGWRRARVPEHSPPSIVYNAIDWDQRLDLPRDGLHSGRLRADFRKDLWGPR